MSSRSQARQARAAQLIAVLMSLSGGAAVSAQQVAEDALPPSAAVQAPAAEAPQVSQVQAQPGTLSEQQPVEAQAELTTAQAVETQQVVEGPRILRNLVVPQFDAPPKSRARAAVLRTLADHTEVEVVSIDDVTFAARRLQADATTPEGRAKLSRELGIDAWLDGKVTETSAHLTLTAGDGTVLQEVEVEADEKVLDARTGEQMWASLGTSLSPQEAYRRAVLAEYERARRKLDARHSEALRQTDLAHKARAHRAFVLRGQFSLAQRKQAALMAELSRQSQNGKAELAREAEEAHQAELARRAEAARKVELARQAEAARKAELAKRREEAKAAVAAKQAAKAAAARAKADAKAVAAQTKVDAKVDAKAAKAKAAKGKAKSERAERALEKRKRKPGASTGLTNTADQRAHARAVAKKKVRARAEEGASQKRATAADGGKGEDKIFSRQ